MEAAFKVKNHPYLAGFVLGNLWVLSLLFFDHIPDLGWTSDFSTLLPAGLASTILVIAVTEVVGGETKARLVFRKWTNPLPGCSAFTEFGPRDPRVDMRVLVERFGPVLPTEPGAQNKLWYRLLKLNEERPSIAYAHQYYLLMRDITFVTVLLIVAAVVAALVAGSGADDWLVAAALLVGEFLLAMRAAESLGRDLVRNVLAEESAKEQKRACA